MGAALKSRWWLAVLVTLAGCASPRYQTVYRYEAPADDGGHACLEQQCSPKLAVCQTACQNKYQVCLKEIEPTVEARYADALKRYERDVHHYRREMAYYQLHLSLGWGYYAPGYGMWPYTPWPEPYYAPPIPPRKPTRDESFKQVRKEKCESDCGCQPIYDACFLSCGGKKIPEVQCIANCPKDK